MNANGPTIVTESGHQLPQLRLSTSNLVNKSIALYGPSKSGKTYFTKNVLDIIRDEVDTAILVSPTEPSNQSFANYIPQPMIHFQMSIPNPKNPQDLSKRITGTPGTLGFINMVWDRQKLLTEIYERANRLRVLQRLFERLPPKVQAQASTECIGRIGDIHEKTLHKLLQRFRRDTTKLNDETEKLRKKHEDALCSAYKHYVWNNIEHVWKKHKEFSEDEQYAIHYIALNPKTVIIFDDCAAQFTKPIQNKNEFRQYFYQNRHVNLTVIFSFQDDTDLVANLRKNAFMSVFCTDIVCRSNFERTANSWDKATRKRVEEYISEVYGRPEPERKHAKLLFYREDVRGQHFYYVQPGRPQEKMFGSPAYLDLCRALESNRRIDSTNPYFDTFRIA